MRIVYNDIDLGVVETFAFDCTAVYDDSGVDYLYTKFEIVVRAVVNGQVLVNNFGANQNGPVMSYEFGAQDFTIGQGAFRPRPQVPVAPQSYGVPPDGAGTIQAPASRLRDVMAKPNAAPLTHVAVRHRLQTPRAKLYVFGGAPTDNLATTRSKILMLESPSPGGYVTDCKNGPVPKVLSVNQTYGDATTMMVDFAVETYVNESGTNGVSLAGALLSNRFLQTHVIDDAGYTAVVTAGLAVFRTDFLYKFLESPDQRRSLIFIPIAPGFVRENIQVTGREDVTGIEYSFRDVQQPVRFPAGPFARAGKISAFHRQALVVDEDDILTGALNVYQQVLGLKANKFFADQDRNEGDKSSAGKRSPKTPRKPKPSIMGRPSNPFVLPYNPGTPPPSVT